MKVVVAPWVMFCDTQPPSSATGSEGMLGGGDGREGPHGRVRPSKMFFVSFLLSPCMCCL